MNIVVLSGKGGTGKTLASTNLAKYMNANYIDGDVEEPNGFIFLKPIIKEMIEVIVKIPSIDKDKCKKCFKCAEFCRFNALAKTNDKVLVFDKLCHSCEGCKIVCEFGAIEYIDKKVGIIEKGKSNDIKCSRGLLNIGEPMAVPVIKELLKNLDEEINIIDSSPGTSCNVVNILEHADIAILVTEPTNFGLHDLDRAVKLIRKFNIPFGVVINRVTEKENIISKYCIENKIEILMQIDYDREIAIMYSKGELIINKEKYLNIFKELSINIKEKLL
ncbi:MAG TPA: (4Fe-4S)-binding protein [Clostridia bacterium]|nr:(4Fe-4S)-binding protein [Clostridia bacterium]